MTLTPLPKIFQLRKLVKGKLSKAFKSSKTSMKLMKDYKNFGPKNILYPKKVGL